MHNKKNRLGYVSSVLCLVLFFQFFSVQLYGQETNSEWKILGITTVKDGLDKDEVKVKLGQGQLSTIKIKVRVAPLEMNKFEIQFRNGQKQNVLIRKNFSKGSESRAIDLKGDKRFIKKVIFWYNKKKLTNKKPLVVLIGKE